MASSYSHLLLWLGILDYKFDSKLNEKELIVAELWPYVIQTNEECVDYQTGHRCVSTVPPTVAMTMIQAIYCSS